jgi:hypothetical protein
MGNLPTLARRRGARAHRRVRQSTLRWHMRLAPTLRSNGARADRCVMSLGRGLARSASLYLERGFMRCRHGAYGACMGHGGLHLTWGHMAYGAYVTRTHWTLAGHELARSGTAEQYGVTLNVEPRRWQRAARVRDGPLRSRTRRTIGLFRGPSAELMGNGDLYADGHTTDIGACVDLDAGGTEGGQRRRASSVMGMGEVL